MRLQNQLILNQARLGKIGFELTSEDPVITIIARTALTSDVAESFGCRELIYAGSVPRSGVDKIALEGEEVDCEVRFKREDIALTVVANSLGHFVAKMEGDGPKLLFRMRLTGYAADIIRDLIDRVKVDPVELTLRPAQMDLGLKQPANAEKNGPCVACNTDIPLVPNDPSLHMSGSPCTAYQAPVEEAAEEVIQPKRRGGRRTMSAAIAEVAAAVDGETEDPEPSFMEDLEVEGATK